MSCEPRVKAPTLRTISPRADSCSRSIARPSKRISSLRGMILPGVIDSQVEQPVGVFRCVFLDQRIEGKAGEFEDRQQPRIIKAMPSLGEGQRDIDEMAHDVGDGNTLLLGKGFDALVLRGTDAETGLDETRHAASFRTSAWLGYRVPFLPQADFRRKVGACLITNEQRSGIPR